MKRAPTRRAGAVVLTMACLAGAALADNGSRFVEGGTTFQANCAVCHRPNGLGTPGLAPPVTVNPPRFIGSDEGRRQLVLTVLYGMYGDIVVDERHYNFKMPEFARMDDATLASVLNYVAFDLGRAPVDSKPIDAAEIAAGRTAALDGAQVRAHRAELLAAPKP